MKTKFAYTLIILACLFVLGVNKSMATVTVTLTVDEGTDRPTALNTAAHNLGLLLTEINRAQQAKSILTTKDLPMDEFALKSLLRLWAVTPFYCDDEEIVERCWIFKNGTMMVSHIPLIITPEDESFGVGAYQEAVVEFDSNGHITDFRLALDAHTAESMERCGSVVEKERQMIIMQYIERFRTAYNQRDSNYIEQIFSDDALIITGKVVTTRSRSDLGGMNQKVEYTKQTKEQYIRNLKKAFKRNKWINVK